MYLYCLHLILTYRGELSERVPKVEVGEANQDHFGYKGGDILVCLLGRLKEGRKRRVPALLFFTFGLLHCFKI